MKKKVKDLVAGDKTYGTIGDGPRQVLVVVKNETSSSNVWFDFPGVGPKPVLFTNPEKELEVIE